MKAQVDAYNQEKGLVGAFSVIVKTDGLFAALFYTVFDNFFISASNYIISGSTGFTESAKACAVIEESPRATDTLATSSYTTPSLPSKAGE